MGRGGGGGEEGGQTRTNFALKYAEKRFLLDSFC